MLKKPLLSLFLFFLSLSVAVGQEAKDNATYYYNIFDNNTQGSLTFTNASLGITPTAATNNLNVSSGRALRGTGNSTAGTAYASYVPAGTSLTNDDWEWSFLYKNASATSPDDSRSIDNNENSWRYWLIADGTTSNTAVGLYVTQIGTTLYLRYKYTSNTDGSLYNQALSFTVANNTTYAIKVQRLKNGLLKWYIDPYTSTVQEAKTLRGSTTGSGSPTSYNYSMLESSTTTAGRFLFDDLKMYTMQFQFVSNPAGVSASPVTAGQTGTIVYSVAINMRGNYEFTQLLLNEPSGAANYLTSESLYKSADDTFTPTSPAPDTLKQTGNGSGYFSNINDAYQSSGNSTNGALTTVGYYYLSGTTKSPVTPGTFIVNGVTSITTKDYNGPPAYTGYSTSTAGPAITFATLADWTGAGTDGNWNNTANWSTGAVPTSTNAVRIGVLAYTRQPTITATPPNIGSLTFGTLRGSNPVNTANTLTVNSGFTLEVLGDIVQNHQTGTSGNYSSYITTLTGAGAIICDGNFQVGNTTAPATTSANLLDISSRINLLTIKGNVILNAVGNNATGLNYPAFDIDDKKVLLNGQIVTTATNSPTNNYYSGANSNYSGIGIFCMDNNSNASTLELTNNTPIANFLTNMIIDFNNNGSGAGTVIYNSSSGNQTVYTQANTPYIGTNPDHYENLILTGASTKVFNGTSVNIGGDVTSSTGPVDFNTNNPSVTIDGNWTNAATATQGSGLITLTGSLTNSGTLNLGSANITIAGSYTNTGTYSQGAGTTIFSGTTQSLTDNGNGTKFNNVTFQGGGTKTMNTGTNGFSVAALYTLNVIASSTLAVGSTSSTSPLTILSDLSGDGSIGSLAAGTITGNINVQRFMKGGTATGLTNGRGYRLLSSPVFNTTTATGSLAYNLIPLKVNTLISGPTGGGFDSSPSATPSVFMYDENSPATTAPNSIPASDYKGFATTSEYVPMGNGIMFYFRGNQNVSKTGGSGNAFTGPTFPIAESTTLNFFGQLAPKAGFTVSFPTFKTAPQTLYKTSATTTVNFNSYMSQSGPGTNTGTDSTGNSGKKGFNIVGNPYPSAIDLETFYTANRTNAAAVVSLSKYIYFLRRSSASYATSYAVFDASGGKTPGAGASRYVLSGQGFFVRALNSTSTATTAAIKFTEAMKDPYPNGTSPATIPSVFSLKNFAGNKEAVQTATSTSDAGTKIPADAQLRLELQQDSTIYNTTDISFASIGKERFNPIEDALYLGASGQSNKLYSVTTDSTACFVKYMPELGKTKKIKLGVSFGDSGLYTISAPVKTNFPPQYAVYLIDTYLKDSLDVTHNPTYNFRIDKGVAASYAADRFYLSVNKVPGYEYRLLDFAGNKITEGVKLNWKTEFEGDNTGFDIERSIDGGKSFTYLGAVKSSGIGTYAFTDRNPKVGTNLYRLKQTDINNNDVYSKIVTIGYQLNNDQLTTFMVYPSTTTRDITISFGKVYNDNIKVTISNAIGNVVKTFKTSATDKIQSQVSALPVGVYFITAVDESTGKVIGNSKFVKQ
jgi:hypothetical protein